jgi:hypothetical protein
MDNDADETQEQAGDTTASSTISKKSLVANPPSTANISNMIIDEPSDK